MIQFIALTRYNPGALGRITEERSVRGEPLYTVRLEKEAWPGGSNRIETRGGECRYVDLRAHEFERISHVEFRRLKGLPISGPTRTKRERDRDNARAYRDRKRAAS